MGYALRPPIQNFASLSNYDLTFYKSSSTQCGAEVPVQRPLFFLKVSEQTAVSKGFCPLLKADDSAQAILARAEPSEVSSSTGNPVSAIVSSG